MSAKSSDVPRGLVLAIDACMGGCVAGLYDPAAETCAERGLRTEREQAAKLIPMIQELLGDAGAAFADVGLLVTTSGPGSFTGLRIGLSAARSLSLALDVPLQGVSTFEAVRDTCARGGDENGFLVVLEAKRRDFYVRPFDAAGNGGAPACLETPDILALARGKDLVLCGDAAGRLAAEAGDAFTGLFRDIRGCVLPSGAALARRGRALFARNGGRAEKVEPFYMRGADVSLSSKAQRKIAGFPE